MTTSNRKAQQHRDRARTDRPAPRGTVGLVVAFDYLSAYGGAVQRIKGDVAALRQNGYQVEMICPSRFRKPHQELPSGLTLFTYRNVQHLTFLPEKARLVFDLHTQMFSPFFHSALRRRCAGYSVVFAHSPWSVVASHRVVRRRMPLIYVAHNFEYGLIRQASRNPVVRRLVYHVEKSACRKATRILCVSERDLADLAEAYRVPREKLALLPNTVDVDFFAAAHTLYDRASERRKLGLDPAAVLLLFHGRMDYRANAEALRFIMDDLMPALRRSPDTDIRLVVAGAQIPGWCLERAGPDVSCHSDVPDMRRFLAVTDAVIVPLNIGGGTRLKILESFAAGVPVISTAKGMEGIDCRDGQHALIAERTAADFADRIKMLAGDRDLQKRLTSNARDLVVEKYSIAVAARSLQQVIQQATHTNPAP